MNLDSTRADSQFECDFAVMQTIGDSPKHLMLAWSQACDQLGHLGAFTDAFDRLLVARQRRPDRLEQLLRLHRLPESRARLPIARPVR